MYGHGGFRGRRVACVGNRPRLPEIALICEIRIKWPRRLGVSGESVTYPNGPYGQGFPGQPGYPQQPVWPQQPGYPGAQPPYGPPPVRPTGPSGTTAIMAAVLAGLGGLSNLTTSVIDLFGLMVAHHDDGLSGGVMVTLILIILLNSVGALSMLAGSATLVQRKIIGRWLVIVGCAATILACLVGIVLYGFMPAPSSSPGSLAASVGGLVFPTLTLVLALLPSTTRWIEAKPNPIAPQYYPPYQG